MAIYAIGDVQGCLKELLRLVEKLNFDPGTDQLWFTGDLVNRGPESLETLRYIRSLGSAAQSVLGNHDLHLLAVAAGVSRARRRDTLSAILAAADRDDLLTWLRHRPLLHTNGEFYLIHAGVPPQWSISQTRSLATEAEAALQGADYRKLLEQMYGDQPDHWSEALTGYERLRFIINCLTRLRYCTLKGTVHFRQKGRPGTQPPGLIPWFEVPNRLSSSSRILFGHWSTLGFHAANNAYGLDTGCLWGGELTALRLDTDPPVRTSVASLRPGGYQTP